MLLFYFCVLLAFGCKQNENEGNSSEIGNYILALNNGDLRINEKVFHKSIGDCKTEKNCVKIHIEYPEIISDGEAYDSINIFIKNTLINLSFNEDLYNSLDELSDSLFSSYLSLKEDFPDYNTGWYIDSKIAITAMNFDILSLKTVETIFTGGANPSYNLLYNNFDISNGLEIVFSDIISEENYSQLEKHAENIFRVSKGISKNESLSDKGFWFENNQFSLNDNFTIADSGIVFYYNLYEIAPRSMGSTELFIPKNKLIGLTKIYK